MKKYLVFALFFSFILCTLSACGNHSEDISFSEQYLNQMTYIIQNPQNNEDTATVIVTVPDLQSIWDELGDAMDLSTATEDELFSEMGKRMERVTKEITVEAPVHKVEGNWELKSEEALQEILVQEADAFFANVLAESDIDMTFVLEYEEVAQP
ncbi:hypothetical protein [Pseudoflavonifractor phocaeensis]|uniref:hypothetical protein n=1 Tax=Pseudoflavonifractor phocaeensis TaxID=1870988 RepID=UPI0019571C19|nr:hypothetical protein [Pseudoflavonifractor phocaeensis]MBM6869814.1 hypothetical protein [Pseudoflavonifractor phocaeensis]